MQDYKALTLICRCIQVFSEPGRSCSSTQASRAFQRSLAEYAARHVSCTSKVISARGEVQYPLRKNSSLRIVEEQRKGTEGLDADALYCPPNTDDALGFVTYLLFARPQYLIPNYDLYVQGDAWDEVVIYVLESNKLPQVFAVLLKSVLEVIEVNQLSSPRPNVVKLENQRNAVKAPTADSPPMAPVY